MTAFSAREKIEMEEFLKEKGFQFEKRKLRKPGTKEILVITVGTKRLDKEKFGQTVICINLDAERDHWFVASSWEQSQLNQVQISEIKDDKLKLAAAAYISTVKGEFKALIQNESPEESQPSPEPSVEEPEKVEPPKKETPICDSASEKTDIPKELKVPVEQLVKTPTSTAAQSTDPEPSQLQVIKNVGQAKVVVIKNTKGYNWELTAYADNMNDAIDQAIAADMRLKNHFWSDV